MKLLVFLENFTLLLPIFLYFPLPLFISFLYFVSGVSGIQRHTRIRDLAVSILQYSGAE
jgi:hypothetical protein